MRPKYVDVKEDVDENNIMITPSIIRLSAPLNTDLDSPDALHGLVWPIIRRAANTTDNVNIDTPNNFVGTNQ